MDYMVEARKLVKNLDERMGPSPYDIAWMARLQVPGNGKPQWPGLVAWLLENQHPDGSWGGKVVYYHERVVCTLTALIALHYNGQGRQAQEAISRAERYLWRHLHLLSHDPFELVGFELIVPTLIREARELGLDVPSHAYGYEEIQTAKLRLIPFDMLYSPDVTTVHSLEFLGYGGDVDRLQKALFPNGSLGNSPAATAYYLSLCPDDERAFAYLQTVMEHMGYPIYLYPFRIFELNWVLNNLSFSRLPLKEFAGEAVFEDLRIHLDANGTGLDPSFGIPDGDTTSVCVRMLASSGYDVDPDVLRGFEDPETHIFRTYDYERNASVGTNVHALEALHVLEEYPNRSFVQDQIILMLLERRIFKTYWVDKWHASPYYATSHVLIALLGMKDATYVESICRPTVDWLLHTQREDGSWGFFEDGTAEETAYALTALLHYNLHHSVSSEILQRGIAYLQRTYEKADENYPELWIGKGLFVPYDVVRSAILATLILYEESG